MTSSIINIYDDFIDKFNIYYYQDENIDQNGFYYDDEGLYYYSDEEIIDDEGFDDF